MIDTHTHLYFPDYGEEISDVMQRCMEAGVNYFILPNVDEDSFGQMRKFHEMFPSSTYMAMGLHPTEIKDNWQEFLEKVDKELATGNYIAVGEVGIDLYWDKSTIELQKKVFEKQLELAVKYRLPVIIHSRDAFEETMEVIEKVKPDVPLIFHSFTGSAEDVERIRKGCNPFFGINGVVTYKNAQKLRDALPGIGLEHIILETDSPYLTPVPNRGKRNDSSNLKFICEEVARCLGLSIQQVESTTNENAAKIFTKAHFEIK